MLSSIAVAREFQKLAEGQRQSLTHMQAQNLVYIAHGWMLALYRRPLVRDEVQAWRSGPVAPALYQSLKRFVGKAITEEIPVPEGDEPDKQRHQDELDIIRQTFESYGMHDAVELSGMTRALRTPWHLTYQAFPKALISADLLQHHYAMLLQSAEEDEQQLATA